MSRTSSLRKNAVLNTIKQVCSIIYPMITFPYVSRILGTFYYGKISFGSSIISYISMIAALGITNYAVREGARIKDDKEKLQQFCNEVFSINVLSTVLAYFVLFVLILFWKKLDGYTTLLLIQASTVLFTTIGTDWINSVYEDYEYITVRYIICQGVAVLLMFLLVHDSSDYLLYALTSAIGTVLANLMNVGYIRRHFDLHPRFTIHMNVRRNMKPILMLFGTSIATTIYVNSDITILGILKDENEVGLYTVSSKFYSMVKQVLNASLTVAIPRIAYERSSLDQETLNTHLGRILGDLVILSFPASAGLCSLSENLIVLFSGAEYRAAYTSLEILSMAIIFATMGCFYLNVIMIPFERENKVLFATLVSAVINIGLNFVLIPSMGQNAAALTTLLSEITVFCMGIWYTRDIVQIHAGRTFVTAAMEMAAVFVICGLLKKLALRNIFTIALCVVASVLACALILWVRDREKFKALFHSRRRKK